MILNFYFIVKGDPVNSNLDLNLFEFVFFAYNYVMIIITCHIELCDIISHAHALYLFMFYNYVIIMNMINKYILFKYF